MGLIYHPTKDEVNDLVNYGLTYSYSVSINKDGSSTSYVYRLFSTIDGVMRYKAKSASAEEAFRAALSEAKSSKANYSPTAISDENKSLRQQLEEAKAQLRSATSRAGGRKPAAGKEQPGPAEEDTPEP